ncbi:MAG: FapA family protein, partial [Spirochaetia bacterium]
PSKPGVPGRTVTGEPVYPDPLAETNFYTGKGIIKRQDELTAEYTGFLRIGKHWADIVPFRRHSWSVKRSKDNSTILFSFQPGHDKESLPSTEEIYTETDALDYPKEYLLEHDEIEKVIHKAFHHHKELIDFPLSRQEDAGFNLKISDEKDKVFLDIKKGRGKGKPLELKEIGRAIKALHLKNLETDRIKDDLTKFYRGSDMVLMQYVVAQGKAPEKGPSQDIEYSIRPLDEKNVKDFISEISQDSSRLSAFENLDKFSLDEIQTAALVDKEQRIAILTPIANGEPGFDVFGNSIPGFPGDSIKIQILGGIKQIENILVSETAGICQVGEKEGTTLLRITPYRTPTVKVRIDDSRMNAFLTLKEGAGCGKKLDLDTVMEAVGEAGVSYGINSEVINESVISAKENQEVSDVLIAQGKPPVSSGRSEIEFLVHLASGSEVSIQANGKADYKNRDNITLVKKGTEIAQVLKPDVEPEPGIDITGKKIEPRKADALEVIPGEQVESIERDGKTVFISKVDGEVSYQQGKLDVNPVHVVPGDLDMKVGNIKFPGSVIVKGGINSGFALVSGGDVIVGEGVDRSLISSEGKVAITLGVKGGGKAVIRTKKSIEAGFAEQAVLLAVYDIIIKTNIIHCRVKCNGSLVVSGDKGGLIGGKVKAREGIKAVNIGSSRGIRTEISFGQDYLISDQIEQEEKKVDTLKAQIAKLDTEMRNCEKNGCREDLEELRREKVKQLKVLEKRGLRLFTLRERFEQHFDSKIEVAGTLYPGTILESHGRFHEVKEQKKNVAIIFDQQSGRILIEPMDKK